MTTREQLAGLANSFVGTVHVSGYNEPNPFSHDLNRPTEAWCGDFVTDVYKRAGVPLPSMQPGCRTGFAYCPDAVNYGRQHPGMVIPSWEAQPGDIVLFDWDGNGVADHTEIAEGWSNSGVLTTVGGNSSPNGGVNRHEWTAKVGQGNRQVIAVLRADHLVKFTVPEPSPKPVPEPSKPARLLMLKTPMMHGSDVRAMQEALAKAGYNPGALDGVLGPHTRDALMAFQKANGLAADGIRGPLTYAKLKA